MNIIFIISLVLLSIVTVLLILQNTVIKHYKKTEKEQNLEKELSVEEKKNLRLALKSCTEAKEAKQKTINMLLNVLKVLIANALQKKGDNILNNKMPFKLVDIDNSIMPLHSIRFKIVKDAVNIYLNGAMVATDDIIVLNDYSSLDDKDFVLYKEIMQILQSAQYSPSVLEELEPLISK